MLAGLAAEEPPFGTVLQTDISLVCRARTGDQEAFDQLYDRHARWASKLAYTIVLDHHVAQEVLQESFLQAWRGLRFLRRPESFGPLLHTVVVRVGLRVARAEREVGPLPTGAEAAGAVDWTEEVEERQALRQALAALSPAHRAVLVLRYLRGFTEAEIARMMACPVGTVRSRLFFARRHMADCLEIDAGLVAR